MFSEIILSEGRMTRYRNTSLWRPGETSMTVAMLPRRASIFIGVLVRRALF